MKITDIKIRKLLTDSRMKAVVSLTFDDILAIHDIKIIKGNDKLFLAMPSRKTHTGEYRDIVHPTCAALREEIEKAVIERYIELTER
jgi:stage V sporulation protein G